VSRKIVLTLCHTTDWGIRLALHTGLACAVAVGSFTLVRSRWAHCAVITTSALTKRTLTLCTRWCWSSIPTIIKIMWLGGLIWATSGIQTLFNTPVGVPMNAPQAPIPLREQIFTTRTAYTIRREGSEGVASFAGSSSPHRLPDAVCDFLPHGWDDIAFNDAYEVTEEGWVLGNHPEVTRAEMMDLHELLKKNVDVFAYSLKDLKGCTMAKFTSKPETDVVAGSRRQRWSAVEQEVVDEKCNELFEAGFIRPAEQSDKITHIHACVVAAKKDSTGAWLEKRYCMDLRPTNQKTVKDPYVMPLPDQLFESMGRSKFFTCFDMRSGFLNHEIPRELQRHYAFWWKDNVWVYTRMPFGGINAPAHYQRVMDALIREAGVQKYVCCYIDDVVVHTNTVEEHKMVLEKLLAVFRKHQMYVHPKKTLVLAKGIEFLGHVLMPGSMGPHEAKIAAFKNLAEPKTVSDVRSLLGMLQFYCGYVAAFAHWIRPITELLQKGIAFIWGDAQFDRETSTLLGCLRSRCPIALGNGNLYRPQLLTVLHIDI
jgi:hypothetical protein